MANQPVTWPSFGLDTRLEKAVAKCGWAKPTQVQTAAIPYALKGKDIFARAKTGSGKTGAFLLPILQKLVSDKEAVADAKAEVKALILVPTRELCEQISDVLTQLLMYLSHIVSHKFFAADQTVEAQRKFILEKPDIVISTPGRIAMHIVQRNIDVSTIQFLVIDEADVVLSYGYEDDIGMISKRLPKIYQGFLTSATLDDKVKKLSSILHSPVMIELKEDEQSSGSLDQYCVQIEEKEKFLLTYSLLKLKLIAGKMLIFVSSIDRCFKVKLFLERFSIKSAILNSELPYNSRYHILQQFNKGLFDILIATDTSSEQDDAKDLEEEKPKSPSKKKADSDSEKSNDEEDDKDSDDSKDSEENEASEDEASKEDEASEDNDASEEDEASKEDSDDDMNVDEVDAQRVTEKQIKQFSRKVKRRSQKQKQETDEFGVVRGIDFQDVSIVLNFDFPSSCKSYTHRIGRTARGGKSGIALSFYGEEDLAIYNQVVADQTKQNHKIMPYEYKASAIEVFRYRVTDILRGMSRLAIREARFLELRQEILNSQRLKAYFEENPKDLERLQHDKVLQSNKVQTHLKVLPNYLLPSKPEMDDMTPLVSNADAEYTMLFPRLKGMGRFMKRNKKRRADSLQDYQFDTMSGGDERKSNKKRGPKRRKILD